MRRIVIWLASTVTVVVLLFGYHTSTDTSSVATPTPSVSSPATTSEPSTSTPSASPTTSTPTTSTPTPSSTPASSSPEDAGQAKTYTGSVAQTRWGPVQVEITVTADKVTNVDVLQQPSGNPRDVEINTRALPTLIAETKAASSADIDMVSGATVTSDGYLQSLQAALDKAGI